MVSDQQVLRLRFWLGKGKSLSLAAVKAGMDRKTAAKYRHSILLPSEVPMHRDYRTRKDPFDLVWPWVEDQLALSPDLLAKPLFEALQRRHPGQFPDGQLRSFQRRLKHWRAASGPAKEVFFAQLHHPGRLAASDFTHCSDLGVTLAGLPFPHLLYHFVLTYSNWETCSLCFSESFESLSHGLQSAFWDLGGVPQFHRTDRLGACVQPGVEGAETFKRRYQALLSHYGLQAQTIQAGKGNENGDAEQSHHQLKRALDQALMLRGSRDFPGRDAYLAFLRDLLAQRNARRCQRLAEEIPLLRKLPDHRLEACKRLRVRVEQGSLVRVAGNVYSVPSRLIGEWVEARLYAETVEIFYAQAKVQDMPRLRGKGKHHVNYRHIIDWLQRKPGAFADYRYRADLFPSSRFRMAYDVLVSQNPARATKEYLAILDHAAKQGEALVEAALQVLFDATGPLSAELVQRQMNAQQAIPDRTSVLVEPVDLKVYDGLLQDKETFDDQEQGHQGNADGLPEGAAPASVPEQLRGNGGNGAAGGA